MQLIELVPKTETWWFELTTNPTGAIAPASTKVVESWKQHGVAICAQAIAAEPFWATQEITECPALLEATVRALDGPCP